MTEVCFLTVLQAGSLTSGSLRSDAIMVGCDSCLPDVSSHGWWEASISNKTTVL